MSWWDFVGMVWIELFAIGVGVLGLAWRDVRRIANLNARARREASTIRAQMDRVMRAQMISPEEYLKACDRGLDLLRAWLSPEQLQMFEQDKHFEVRGSSTGWRYWIEWGTNHNVILFDHDGKMYARLCFVPQGPNLVPGDVMLHQKLVLEHDEMSALAVAARFHGVSEIYERAGYPRWAVEPVTHNSGGAGGVACLDVPDPVAPPMRAIYPVSLTRWTD